MLETICAICDHVWNAFEPDRCPQCGQEEVLVLDNTIEDWGDGHYEGGFPMSPGQDRE